MISKFITILLAFCVFSKSLPMDIDFELEVRRMLFTEQVLDECKLTNENPAITQKLIKHISTTRTDSFNNALLSGGLYAAGIAAIFYVTGSHNLVRTWTITAAFMVVPFVQGIWRAGVATRELYVLHKTSNSEVINREKNEICQKYVRSGISQVFIDPPSVLWSDSGKNSQAGDLLSQPIMSDEQEQEQRGLNRNLIYLKVADRQSTLWKTMVSNPKTFKNIINHTYNLDSSRLYYEE